MKENTFMQDAFTNLSSAHGDYFTDEKYIKIRALSKIYNHGIKALTAILLQ